MGLTASRRCDTDGEAVPVWKPQDYPCSVCSYWHSMLQKHMEGMVFPLTACLRAGKSIMLRIIHMMFKNKPCVLSVGLFCIRKKGKSCRNVSEDSKEKIHQIILLQYEGHRLLVVSWLNQQTPSISAVNNAVAPLEPSSTKNCPFKFSTSGYTS